MLPTHILIDATLKTLSEKGIFYTIIQRGERNSGIILLKLWGRGNDCKLLTQQRDLDGDLRWMNVTNNEILAESDADAYIQRARPRDPDLWVIEIEDPDMNNPFDT
ncbi:DUF1491 family protein [Alphaproteobacteria bacterium]|nr:DUF1491 family protein [Alphaproteobacteria bacterium]